MNIQQFKALISRDVKVVSPDIAIIDTASKMPDGDFVMFRSVKITA